MSVPSRAHAMMEPCASPTPSSSAGTGCPAAPRSLRCASPRRWARTTTSASSGSPAATATSRPSRGCPPSPWCTCRWRHRGCTRRGCAPAIRRSRPSPGRWTSPTRRRSSRARPTPSWWSPCTTSRSCTSPTTSPSTASRSSRAASSRSAVAPIWCCAAVRRRWTTACRPASTANACGSSRWASRRRAPPTRTWRGCAATTRCPSATCCSSARSSRARTCAAWSPRWTTSTPTRRRWWSPVPTGGATPATATTNASASSASCLTTTSPGCTPVRRCSATRANARATASPCSKRWPRARPSSPAAARPPRRPRGTPPCSSTRSITSTSLAASTRPCVVVPSCSAKGLARAQRRSWAETASLTAAAYRELAG